MSFDYTPDRHVASSLTALDQIAIDNTIMRARSGQELPFGVFAARCSSQAALATSTCTNPARAAPSGRCG